MSEESRRPQAPRSTRWVTALADRALSCGAVASIAALGAAALDARWAARGADVSMSSLALVDFGLIAPVAALTGVGAGIASWVALPDAPPSVGGLLARLRRCPAGETARRAALAPLVLGGALLWTTAAAHLARAVLALDLSAGLAGTAIATGSVALGVVVAVATLSAVPRLKAALARAASNWNGWVDPAVTGALGLVAVALAIAFGVATGDVSGQGGALGVFGIFKRQELDLRAPGLLLGLVVAGWALAPRLQRAGKRITAAATILPCLFVVQSDRALGSDGELAAALERGAPLAKRPLAVYRRLTDRDGDGASARFGGGDCDDTRRDVGPEATEVPGNGVDEDCSGSDLSLADLKAAAPPPPAKPKPGAPRVVPKDGNLILITIDTLRHDLGYAGYKRAVSPNLDKLAARSTVYEHAYALASYTGKSVGPTLIGKYGSETHRNWGHFNKFGTEDTFLAQRLKGAGVRTIGVHGHRYFGKWGGLERGFDELDMSAAPPEDAKWAKDDRVTSEALTDAAIARLKTRQDERFFLWVHYLDPHADYKSHEGVPRFGSSARDMYDHEVAFTDKHIGRLLDFVSAAPFAKKTSIVVTSDHGEAFGEHDMWRHGVELWEPLVRVPLIVHVPGLAPKRVKTRRSLIDLVPTALDLMSLPPVPHRSAAKGDDFVSGASWLPDFTGKPAPRDILVDMPAGPYNESRRAYIHGDLKVIVSGGRRMELYDLAADPGERKNLWRKDKARMEKHIARTKASLREVKVEKKKK